MPAQGTALGIGSRVENSNALKGQNRTGMWSRILFRPFRAGRIFIRIRSPGPTPQAGFPPPGLACFGPYLPDICPDLRGGRNAQHQNNPARAGEPRSRARPRPWAATGRKKHVACRVRRACDDTPLSVPVRLLATCLVALSTRSRLALNSSSVPGTSPSHGSLRWPR